MSSKVVFLEPGTVIGSANEWNQGGAPIILHGPEHTALDGKTGYVGFRIQVGDAFHYGWMRMAISATNGCTLLEYQYNEKPNEGIAAGADCSIALSAEEQVMVESFTIKPNPTNDNIMIDFNSDMPIGGAFVIHSITGIEMKRIPLEQSLQEISLQDLATGMYVISLIDHAGHRIRSQSIIKH